MSLTPSATPSQPHEPSTHQDQPAPAIQQQQDSPPDLPPPQLFDVLPALHELLARIDHTSPNSTVDTSSSSTSQSTSAADTLEAHYADLIPLEPKDLPNEVLAIKTRIRRALRELEKLPDMHRGVNEQREELVALEARVKAQRAMVGKLAEMARGMEG